MIAPQVMLIADAVIVRAWSEAAKAATFPTSSSIAPRPSRVGATKQLGKSVAAVEVGGNRVDDTAGQQRHDGHHAVRLAGELLAQCYPPR